MVPILIPLLLMASPADDWSTEFERTGGRLTSTYAQTIEYCRRLDKASKWIRFESFGKSGEGRDLPLLIVDKNGDFSAERAHKRGKAIVFVQAGIHSGEIDGKDAGLILVREMAITRERADLLDRITLVFIPIYNVDGHEHVQPYNRVNQKGPENAGFRATATFLNLNRDYMKADAPETRAWLSLWNRWDPDFFVDCHVTNGADYAYVVTYLMEVFANADPGVAAWSRDRFVPELEPRMRESGFPVVHYVEFRRDHDPASGLKTWASTPRFSTGYVALANRPALLVETHMLKDYATRVTGTHAILQRTLEIVGEQADEVRRINVE
ncbi:MAG TPA: M14 family metallopeptidase, partial [Candidatus Krumholzibacteria bacterium]|nr:M14 family metallopeptidase [Candidatus Krumholzibacteria bacterium]